MHAVIKAVSNRKGPQVQVIGTVDVEDGVAVPSNRRVARILHGCRSKVRTASRSASTAATHMSARCPRR